MGTTSNLPSLKSLAMVWSFLTLMLLANFQLTLSQLTSNTNTEISLKEENFGHEGYGWPVRIVGGNAELSHCDGLGFRDASENNCSFCVGGSTNLPQNYFMDCEGKCEGNATGVDCKGDCKGTAYIDECSGKCIGGQTGKDEADVKSFRDCRGTCTSSGLLLYTDSCGVCHTGVSPFQDCTNRCHLPGQEKLMAKLVCGRCVGGMTGIPESELLDKCGNCKSDAIECPCNGTGQPDICGECNGGGRSCMRVTRFTPRALLVDARATVVIEGAFRGRRANVKCIFIKLQGDVREERIEFPGSGNGSHVQCQVYLKLGSYRVGVMIDTGTSEEDYIEEMELLVHEQPEYNNMSPTNAVFDRDGAKELTVTFSGSRIPRLPLICVIIVGDGLPEKAKKRLVPSEANTLDSCVIPYPNSSVEMKISPSFNGIHTFKQSFTLQFYASPPDMKKYYIAEDGNAVVVVFDRPVNLCNLETCPQILNTETLRRLGEGANCKWATKQQLIITVQNPIKGNPFRVTFRRGILKQDGQKFAHSKNESLTIDAWYPQPVSNAQLAISGPATIPYCGVFTLVGHFSSPKGDAEFYWTAYRDDKRPLETVLANVLLRIRSSSLTLNCSILQVDLGYIFVLTAEHPGNEKHEARHRIKSVPYIGPLVSAYSDVMSQSSVTTDQKITLQADVGIPDCSPGSEFLSIMWSVSNPEVKFNFKRRSEYVYVIEPYSLPENSLVTFYANAFFLNMLNITNSQVQLRVEPVKLKAAIKGASKRFVGNKEGTLVLESEMLNKGYRLVYQWRCYDEDGPVCYNYKTNSTEPLLITRQMQNKPNLTIPCANLKAGKTLKFELQVFNANNRYQSSQTASTVVVVEDKDIPQVFIASVLADGINAVQRHPTTSAYNIPAGLPVSIHATITPGKSPIKAVKWDIKGFSSAYTFTTRKGMTILSLEEGFLVGHGIYLIGLSACDAKGACGIANLSILAVPGISLCKPQLEPYVEYEMITVEVKGCSIPTNRQPVNYQLFLHSAESIFPFTPPQTSTIFTITGPPRQTNNDTRISVQACDKYALCTLFTGPPVNVTLNERKAIERGNLIQRGVIATESRDLLPAISMFLTAASDPRVSLSNKEVEHMLDAASNATNNRYINVGQLSLIYSSMLPLLRMKENSIKLKALDIIKRSTKLTFGHNVKVPSSVLAQGHSNAAEALQFSNSDAALTNKVKDVLNFFVERVSSSMPLGSKVQLSSQNPGYPSTMVFRQLLDGTPIYLKTMSSRGLMEGSVRFEESVRQRIRLQQKEGVVVAITLYPESTPFSSSSRLTSPVMDITLRRPDDGKPHIIVNVPNAVRIALTHRGNNSDAQNRGVMYRCAYWDEKLNDWSAEGVVTYGIDGSVMRCWSSHLTAFAVIESYDGLSTGAIVGIVVTVLMGIFIIMGFAFVFFRKKQAAGARVSHQTLPKRDKLQNASGSVVKVKTITP
ncbi:hypothetical protein JTE90_005093 [Oedothorax gibbosus]|uniref:PKD/REJ-like domain-containing protein n=1 Tax=Oedothorax gibbosus TaxID=931172 RepID=A0AAV6VAS5_9ARAC|nr:hypothetical protein JTE90_005093 [Oedothorax gibbosus]